MIPGFIGRQPELRKFETALDNFSPDSPHIAFIYDAAERPEEKGGIGKTKLLQEFARIAKLPKYEKTFLVIDEIFDFYEAVNRDQLSRVSRIVRFLEEKTGTKAFDRFWKNVREYYLKNVSIEKVMEEYFAGHNQLCKETGKKVVRFFDTFEIAEKTLNYLKESYRFIENEVLVNSFIVISGRNQPDLSAPIWTGFTEKILRFPLEGFSDEEAKAYFHGNGFTALEEQQIVQLNRRAKRRPILLALMVDYLKNILAVEDILNLEEKNFKENLVAFIKDFHRPPIDQAILAMAHLKHWCNAKFLQRFVDPNQKFEETYETLKSLSFVRPLGTHGEYVVLHDQMQEMVSEYILKKIDASGALRREISDWATKFYEEEIVALKQREDDCLRSQELAKWQVARDERFILKAELWYHKLYVNRAQNIDDFFFELFDASLERGHLDYCFILQSHLEDLGKLLELSPLIQNRIKLRIARLNTEKYQFTNNQYYLREAEKLFSELTQAAQAAGEGRFLGVMLCDYGTLKFYFRDLLEAEKLLRESVRVLEAVPQQNYHDLQYFLGKSKNWLGYILYQQGNFTESIKILEEAEKHLSAAHRLVVDDPAISPRLGELRREQIDGWIAQVRGNLSRIYREVGDINKSIFNGESSLKRRRNLGNPREIVKGLNTLGLIYSRNGDIGKALKLYEEAEGYLQNVRDPILHGRILTNKATPLFKRDQFSDLLARHRREVLEAAQGDLKVDRTNRSHARKLLKNVIESLKYSNSRELTTAYHNLGELCLMERKYDDAMDCFQDAVRIAKIENDTYTLMNSLQRLVLTAYLKGEPSRFREFTQTFEAALEGLSAREETARYIMRFYITVGNFYFDNLFNEAESASFDENFKATFRAYTEAILYTKSHAQRSAAFAQEVFAERIFELLKAKAISPSLRDELLQAWQKHGLDTNELQRYLDF